ncbi:hypothetical protein CBR_g31985 [Chara braunii]|uniref:Uncharacterized protein n=1 Tax=Chara braunii TaxID=69332 RepID=A0A388LG60_CHABU|nr:hypothetical protein CBR_g31985 [Chara braunii]|eukprot:GBG81310.1 hypothetical protein CBR_g31985 [Chara braunii]
MRGTISARNMNGAWEGRKDDVEGWKREVDVEGREERETWKERMMEGGAMALEVDVEGREERETWKERMMEGGAMTLECGRMYDDDEDAVGHHDGDLPSLSRDQCMPHCVKGVTPEGRVTLTKGPFLRREVLALSGLDIPPPSAEMLVREVPAPEPNKVETPAAIPSSSGSAEASASSSKRPGKQPKWFKRS